MKNLLGFLFIILITTSCMKEGTIEIQSAESFTSPGVSYLGQNPLYSNSTTISLRVNTGPNNVNCKNITHFVITETNTRPAMSEYTQTCSQANGQVVNYNLQDTTEGQHTLYFWSVNKFIDEYSSATEISFTLDTTDPVASFLTAPTGYIQGASNQSLNLSLSDNFVLDQYDVEVSTDGSTWTAVNSYAPNNLNNSLTIPTVDSSTVAYRIIASDLAGNEIIETTPVFTVDSTNPTASITDLPSNLRGGQNQNITFSTTDANGVATWSLEYTTDGTNYTAIATDPVSPFSWTVPAINNNSVSVRLSTQDSAGNTNSASTTNFEIDSINPAISLNNIPAIVTGGANQTVSFSSSDSSGIASLVLDYAADGTTFSTLATVTGSSTYSWTLPSSNTTGSRLRLTSTDQVGNTSSVTSAAFNIDSTVPSASISNLAAQIQGSNNQSVTFAISDANGIDTSTLSYAADGTNFTTIATGMSSPYTWSVPAQNNPASRLRISVTDNAGLTNEATTNSFVVDSINPALTISTPSSPILGGSDYNIVFSATDANSVSSMAVEYAADGTNFSTSLTTTNTSPYTWTLPSTNTTGSKIRITATDPAGNTNTVESSTFNIDSTPAAAPSLSLTSSVYTNSTAATFTAASCGDITHILINEGAAPAAGDAGWQACTTAASAITYTIPTVQGTHTLRAWAKDSVGNVSTTSTDNVIYFDTVDPVIAVSNPGLMAGGGSYTINWTLTENYINNSESFTVEYWDGSSWNSIGAVAATAGPHTTQGYSTSWTAATLDRSDVRVRVTVSDLAGNSQTTESTTFQIDSTDPALTISTPSSPILGGSDYNIVFTATDASSVSSMAIEYAADGTNFSTSLTTTNTSPYTWTLPSTNTTGSRIRITATDPAGNTNTVESSTFNIDSTPAAAPSLSLTSNVYTNSTAATFTAASCGDVSAILINEGPAPAAGDAGWQACTTAASAITYTIPTVQGTHTLRAWAKDSVGNVSTTSTDTVIYFDTVDPVIAVSNPGLMAGGGSYTINWTLTENYINNTESFTVQYWNGSTWNAVATVPATTGPHTTQGYSTSWTAANLDRSDVRVRVTVSDLAGNSQTTESTNFQIDSTAPALTISTPSSPILGGSDYNIVFTATDASSVSSMAVEYAADGTNFSTSLTTTNTSPYTWTLPSTNTTGSRIRITATDPAGNTNTVQSNTFNIDSTPAAAPSLSLTSNVYTNSTAATFTAASCGDVSAILINEGAAPAAGDAGWQACTTAANAITYTIPTVQGAHTLRAWAKDSVGNVSTTSTDNVIYFDTVDPVIAVSNPGLMAGGGSYTINWTLTENYINNTESFTVQYWDGSSWNSIGTVAATTGPHTTQGYSTSWTAANLDRSDVRVRVTVSDLAGNTQTAQSSTFEIDSTDPGLTVSSPANLTYHQSSTVISGNCETGLDLNYTGALQQDFTTTCSGGTYSQTINFSDNDGTKVVNVNQVDAAGNSITVTRTLYRDEVAPILTLTTGNNPDFTNQNTPNTWSGNCEANFTINITGDETTTITCSAGSWNWTPSAETTDGTYSYSLTQTDAAANTSSPPLTVSWERDATAPAFTMSSPTVIALDGTGSTTNNVDQVTLSGNCEGSNSIVISGQESDTISCSSSSWSWTTATYTTDATRSYLLTQTDSAGNTSTINYSWTRDTSGPALQLAETSIKNNDDTVTFSGNCEPSITIDITGTETSSVTCPAGTWTWTSSSQTTDASRGYTFTQTFTSTPFNSTSVSATWLRETGIPTISSFTSTAPEPTSNAFIPVSMSATSQNASVPLTHLCFTKTTTAPTVSDTCWLAVNSPSVGQPLAQTLTLTDFSTLTGWESQLYDMYAWVKDEAENISELSNTGAGTIDTDYLQRTYSPGIAPSVFDITAANDDQTQIPPSNSEASVPAGSTVYIRWKVTDDVALPSDTISIFYTTDDINYTAIATASGIAPHTNHGCPSITLATDEGCYAWTGGSPLTSTYKILVKATDSSNITSQAASNNLNTDILKILAGNTEQGIGGSAQTAIFNNEGTSSTVDGGTLVYTTDGRMFFADITRGILTVDPSDGKLIVFIKDTGSSTGDGGPAESATVTAAIKIALDYQGRLLIFDRNRIRRVDLNQAEPTISTIIGDGSDLSDTVADPLDVNFENMDDNSNYEDAMPFFAMPNGDIVFFSERPYKGRTESHNRIRIYKASTGQVISKYFSGTGDAYNASQDLSKCVISHYAVSFDDLSNFVNVAAMIRYDADYTDCDAKDNSYARAAFDPDTFAAITPANDGNRWHDRYPYTGMDGFTYVVGYRGVVDRMNNDGSFTRVLGAGSKGECIDGTAATSCNISATTLFVDVNSKIYFNDRGAIRTVDDSGNVKTILGQKRTYGDGVLAINGRFDEISQVMRLDNGNIMVTDRAGSFLKEFVPEGNINILAGNGNDIVPNTANPALNNPLRLRSFGALDKATGDYYFSSNTYGNILKLNRSTGNYDQVIGNSSGTSYVSGDGLTGLNIDSDGNSNRSLVLGVNSSTLMLSRMQYDGTNGRYENFRIKAHDISDSFRQSHVMGIGTFPADGNTRKICDGAQTSATASTCDAPYWDTFGNIDYDATNDRWIMAIEHGGTEQDVFAYDPNADTIEKIGHTAVNIEDFYKFVHHSDGSEALYYCNGGKIRKYDLDTETDLGALTWPIANLSCRGKKADYNPVNNSIVFPFIQNGLYGVGEYFLP